MAIFLTAQREQVFRNTRKRTEFFYVVGCLEMQCNSFPWEADVLPLHHSREITIRLENSQYIRLFPTLQLNLFNCFDLHSLSSRSGNKWQRIVLGSRTQSLPPPATCQSSAVRSSNLTKFTHGCIEVLRRHRSQHFRPLPQPHAGRQDRNPLATIADHSPRLSRPSKNGIGFCKASANGVFLWG